MKNDQVKKVEEQLKRLILPPEGIIPAGGIHMPTGEYPKVGKIDPAAHLAGVKTFAIDASYVDTETGNSMTKFGVLDIDDGEASIEMATKLVELSKSYGFSVLTEWSGRKGCHVWIFCEPIPTDHMIQCLKRLKELMPFKGETIPGANSQVKMAPGLHQVSGSWAFFYPVGENPDLSIGENLPDNFFENQAELLAEVVPTPAATIMTFVLNGLRSQPQAEDYEDTIPDLSKLNGTLAPCMAALLSKGGTSELGSYDKNNLTLAVYCKSSGSGEEEAYQLAERLADNTSPDLPTTKDKDGKLRHWESIQGTPAVHERIFNCRPMLKIRKPLGFDCRHCAARPDAVKTGSKEEGVSFYLTEVIGNQLLAYGLQNKGCQGTIDGEIFKVENIDLDPKGKSYFFYSKQNLIWQAISGGHFTPVSLSNWLESLSLEHLTKKIEAPEQTVRKIIQEQTTQLISTLLVAKAPEGTELAQIISKAEELSAKVRTQRALNSGMDSLMSTGISAMQTLQDVQQSVTEIQRTHQQEFGKPMSEYAEGLLDMLIKTERKIIPTPFPGLNEALSGGFQGARMYNFVGLPGGGKTTLTSQMADYAAQQRIPVLFVAMEMSREQIFTNSLARIGRLNSRIIDGKYFLGDDKQTNLVAEAAQAYFKNVSKYLSVEEGDHSTTAASLAAWAVRARHRFGLQLEDPVLIVLDYLQLFNTGNEKIDFQPNETVKISEVAVQLKQLARDAYAAVIAISDITKQEQGDSLKSKFLTLNALRGSNRVAHAGDCVFTITTEDSQENGGQAAEDPWTVYTKALEGSPQGAALRDSLEKARRSHPIGGPSAVAYACLNIVKNRSGNKGTHFLVYHRAHHNFEAVEIIDKGKAKGRK